MIKPNASAVASTGSTWPSGLSSGSLGLMRLPHPLANHWPKRLRITLPRGDSSTGHVSHSAVGSRYESCQKPMRACSTRSLRFGNSRHATLPSCYETGRLLVQSAMASFPLNASWTSLLRLWPHRRRVLVIVMDGMSAAVCRELVADITRQDWIALCEQGREANRPGLAALPSITEVSRTSLLCGQLRQGNAAVEKNGFAEHPGLRAHCRSGSVPVLFHKPSLQEADDTSLAAEVRGEIAASHRRVVGVVVNAVDDYLLKGEQIDTRWSRDEIKVLPTLLHEAKSARRIVILLADHGHVLDHQTQGRPHEGGERWRIDDGNPAADEVQMTGSRVVIPDTHRLIAPWTEKVRYGVKKNGYHGGVSPQEMIIPIIVLCASDAFPAGWREAPITTPAWWDEPFLERTARRRGSATPQARHT